MYIVWTHDCFYDFIDIKKSRVCMKLILYCISLTFSIAAQGTSNLDNMLLFKKIDVGEIEFINTTFTSFSAEKQNTFLSATNDAYQTPLHHALSIGNILAAFAIINVIQDDSLFLYSDAEENTPFSLARSFPHTNLAQQIYAKMPLLIQQNFEL